MIRLFRFLKPYRGFVTIVLVLAFFQSLANLFLPTLNADIIDKGIVKNDTGYIVRLGGVMLLITVGGALCAVVGAFFASRTAVGFGRIIRAKLFTHVEQFSLHEFDTVSTASLITRTTNDTNQVQQVLVIMLTFLVTAPMTAIGGVILAARQDVSLSWVLIAAMPILVISIVLIMSRAIPLFRVMQLKLDRLNLVLDEGLTGVRVIRAFDRTEHERERFDQANLDVTNVAINVNRIVAALFPVMMLVLNLSSMLAMRAEITDPTTPQPAGDRHGYIDFEDVTFSYPGAEEPAIAHISFSARPGQVTAIIGGTGAGKSTLVNLIPRFYDVDSGRVLVDGVEVREMTQAELRAKIGLVPQTAVLFSGTVADNIRFGNEGATDDEVRHAAEVAQAMEFISEMGDGFDATIAQGGTNLSGGQKQRLSIARALVRRPEVYIFDDSFSALDYTTDAKLRAALRSETTNATVLIVAQRVSTIIGADQILVLDEGRLIGTGTHRELMETNDVYREIVLSQVTAEEIA